MEYHLNLAKTQKYSQYNIHIRKNDIDMSESFNTGLFVVLVNFIHLKHGAITEAWPSNIL